MPGRPAKFDTEETLEKAMLLFWEYGYSDTGLALLERHLGLGRQSIYNTFGDKNALFLKAYQHYLDTRLAAALALLREKDTPHSALQHLFRRSLDCAHHEHHGCFIGNTLAAPSAAQEEVDKLAEKAIQIFLAALRETLSPLYDNEQDLLAASWSFLSLFQGVQLLAKHPHARENLLAALDLSVAQLPPEK